MKEFFRTLKELDIDELRHHLLVVGDLTGDCFNCREIGLDYLKVKNCPKCKTDFRYISSRKSNNVDIKIAVTLHKRRPDLIYIEFGDLKQHQSREKAKNLLS